MKIALKVLFVCAGNINRSQIAEAIFNKLSKKNRAKSAGIIAKRASRPLGEQHNNPILPMKIRGYDLSRASVKRVNQTVARSADRIILIFNKRHLKDVPLYLRERPDMELWEIESISGKTEFSEYCKLEAIRINEIEKRVIDLVQRIG